MPLLPLHLEVIIRDTLIAVFEAVGCDSKSSTELEINLFWVAYSVQCSNDAHETNHFLTDMKKNRDEITIFSTSAVHEACQVTWLRLTVTAGEHATEASAILISCAFFFPFNFS